ncbi:hypothetical protein PQ465_07790 [Sphingobacterium oryzagri]|uniref:Uncharacterized protein n=1 Tax=Sphingobacterium oryzagri TaxID=3025669 RepID=A0ABY7WNY7_9SPHI|nr:hypothetical protein [Sphingobacterium sp. KACC 22765]WDF70269.1 hypothetical protein PQ465_07790 [Sphingobacterium sp. KACC 22765]
MEKDMRIHLPRPHRRSKIIANKSQQDHQLASTKTAHFVRLTKMNRLKQFLPYGKVEYQQTALHLNNKKQLAI